MGSGPTTVHRHRRRVFEIAFVLVAIFAAGLVTAGVVSGAGPLALLSDETSTESETTATDTTTDTTSTEPTETEPTESEPTETTTTDPDPTETETTDTETTDTTPAWPDASEPYLVKFASGTSTDSQAEVLAAAGAESQSYIRALASTRVLFPGGDSLQASLDALEAAPSVARVEPDRDA